MIIRYPILDVEETVDVEEAMDVDKVIDMDEAIDVRLQIYTGKDMESETNTGLC